MTAGKSPKNSRVILTSDEQTPGVLLEAGTSHILIRNLTTRYVGNDGFNLHGSGRDIVLENIKALMCGDQGISSHDSGQMTIRDAEVAFCGSRAGGIADINDCVTSYSNVLLHNNRKPVLTLRGGKHEIDGMVIVAPNANALPRVPVQRGARHSQRNGRAHQRCQTATPNGPQPLRDHLREINLL
jgi:hypothetical protein